jgi:hypothetical protein
VKAAPLIERIKRMVTVEDLKQAYDAVFTATEKALNSGLEFEKQKEKVETKILMALASGEIQGKNEGERKAVRERLFHSCKVGDGI